MRFVVLAAGALLAGCVQQASFSPAPIELQSYPPPVTYRTVPPYRPPPAPVAEPLPPPAALDEPIPSANPVPSDDNGAIPIQQMPAPAPAAPRQVDTIANPTQETPMQEDPAPVVSHAPPAGPGSNVPLEGFRPMHGQTRPAP